MPSFEGQGHYVPAFDLQLVTGEVQDEVCRSDGTVDPVTGQRRGVVRLPGERGESPGAFSDGGPPRWLPAVAVAVVLLAAAGAWRWRRRLGLPRRSPAPELRPRSSVAGPIGPLPTSKGPT